MDETASKHQKKKETHSWAFSVFSQDGRKNSRLASIGPDFQELFLSNKYPRLWKAPLISDYFQSVEFLPQIKHLSSLNNIIFVFLINTVDVIRFCFFVLATCCSSRIMISPAMFCWLIRKDWSRLIYGGFALLSALLVRMTGNAIKPSLFPLIARPLLYSAISDGGLLLFPTVHPFTHWHPTDRQHFGVCVSSEP